MSDRTRARLTLFGWAALSAWCLAISLSPGRIDFRLRDIERSDIDFYEQVARRVAGGEGYYTVLADELPRWGFPTDSVFNWRTPLPLWLLAKLPSLQWGRVALGCLSMLLLAGGMFVLLRDSGRGAALLGGVLLIGAALPGALPGLYFLPMLWGGVFIGLSIVAFGLGRPAAGVVLGTLAALFRDLAGGYLMVMWVHSAWRRDRRELLGWTVGLAVFAGWLAWHASAVSQQTVSNPVEVRSDWLQFNGLAFVIGAAQMNGLLLLLPQWVAGGVFFPLAVLGLLGPSTLWQQRASAAALAYCLVFLMIGQRVNQYWGALLTPLLCFGAAQSPLIMARLWKTATQPARN